MPNTLGRYDALFYASETLQHLRKALGITSRIYQGYDVERRSSVDVGSTITIKRPSTFVAQKAGSVTAQALDTQYVDVKITERAEVMFEVPDMDYVYAGERLISDHIAPAAYALADQLDQDVNALYVKCPWLYDYGTATDHTVITGLYKVAFDNRGPMRDPNWHLQIDSSLQQGFQNSNMFIQESTTGPGQNQTLFNGTLGTRYNVEIFANQNAPTHTVGTIISGADQAGALTANLAKGATTMALGSMAATETLKAGDTFSIAGNTQRYAVTADATMVGGAANVTFTPAAVQAYSSSAVVTFYVQETAKAQQLLFHRNWAAIAYGTLPRNVPGLEIETVTDPLTGLSVRASRGGDIVNKKTIISLDVCYGLEVLNPNLAVRGWT